VTEKDKVIVSIHREGSLYFSVGVLKSTNKIVKFSLPKRDEIEAIEDITNYYPDYEISDEYEDVASEISKIYEGKKTDLKLEMLELSVDKSNRDLPVKSTFQRDVLIETYKIPYGEVVTYKSLAEKVGGRAYRAVGTVMANNPFPLIIPCHRVVKSDLTIGKYGGGPKMKSEILKKEGVQLKGDKIVKRDS
jgi:methylated-DNA-[protein]-cysteine S-methyltransferase